MDLLKNTCFWIAQRFSNLMRLVIRIFAHVLCRCSTFFPGLLVGWLACRLAGEICPFVVRSWSSVCHAVVVRCVHCCDPCARSYFGPSKDARCPQTIVPDTCRERPWTVMSQQEYDSGSDQQKIVFSNLREQLTDHQHKNVLTVLNEPNGQDYHLFFRTAKLLIKRIWKSLK